MLPTDFPTAGTQSLRFVERKVLLKGGDQVWKAVPVLNKMRYFHLFSCNFQIIYS